MKKVVFVFIGSLLLAIGIFFAAQYYFSLNVQKGALQVTSGPESKVYLNDKYLGKTPLCKCETSDDMIPAGEYTIRLVPVDSTLREFQEKITISQAVLTVVDRKFGRDALSEGSIISLAPLANKKKAELLVVSFPKGADILLDNAEIGNTPFLYKDPTESDHVLQVKKEGYNEKEVRIRTPLGYKLTVAVYLSISNATSPQSSPSATPTPDGATPTPQQEKVVILDTPTGFLRVRETASTTATEVGKVDPGKAYPLVSEQEGWFEITLEDGKKGWISSEYAQKQQP